MKQGTLAQLTLADEIVVLMLRDDTGEIRTECIDGADTAIAGGILMELSLLGRIDTDLKSLFIVDPSPVGDDLLDRVLAEIDAADRQSSAWWIERLSRRGSDLVSKILERLVQAGILLVDNRRYLWIFSRRAYPQNTGREEREAKARLASVIYSNELPTPRDTLLLGLAQASGVLGAIFPAEEINKAAPRIAEVVALEEIGRSVGAVASDLRTSLARAVEARYAAQRYPSPGNTW
jgi:golgi phosphoprotein 3